MSRASNLDPAGKPVSPANPVPPGADNPWPKEVPPADRRLVQKVCLWLALAVWAVFGQTLWYGFVNYDDDKYVYENPVVERGLTLDGIRWSFTHTVAENWHPLTVMSLMLDTDFYGANPGGYHLTNVVLHTAAVILLFLVLKEMTGALWPSAFVAAVFAIHPLRVESVAWIAERKDVLSGVFFMLTLLCYVKAVKWQVTATETGPASSSSSSRFTLHASRYYWLAVVFFALGLMSKPMLVTLPFVLLLLDYWPLQRFNTSTLQRLLGQKIPFFVLSAAACVVALATQQAIIGKSPLAFRVENALISYVTYLAQMFWPHGLAVLYPYPTHALPPAEVAGAGALLALISAAVFLWRDRRPWLLVGWLWYLVMLLPVIGLVQVGQQAHADRYTYLPQIGLFILLAWGAVDVSRGWRWQRPVLRTAAGLALAGLMVAACIQTAHWKDGVSLWTHTLACTSANETAHNNLGLALADQGQLDDAIQHYEIALKLKPDYADAQNNLGNALVTQGKPADAIPHYQRALQINPHFAKAQCDLGVALASEDKGAEALAAFEHAVQLDPDFVDGQYNLGLALMMQERWPEALTHLQRAVQLKPDYAVARLNLGVALHHEGHPDEAIAEVQQAFNLATQQGNAAVAEKARQMLSP
jgi:tetratricopeptide (TPR) repeat protein